MLPTMFGMGMSEILVILLVAALFLGPEKLPEAATKISKGIRDLRRQTKDLTDTIENDTQIGGAIRDLKSALRGDELRRPPVRQPPTPAVEALAATAAAVEAAERANLPPGEAPELATDGPAVGPALGAPLADELTASAPVEAAGAPAETAPAAAVPPAAAEPAVPASASADATTTAPARVTLPPTAGESERAPDDDEEEQLARLVRPASGVVKRDGHGAN
jgi:sec-independent protein translocase protein TatB